MTTSSICSFKDFICKVLYFVVNTVYITINKLRAGLQLGIRAYEIVHDFNIRMLRNAANVGHKPDVTNIWLLPVAFAMRAAAVPTPLAP